MHSRGGGLRPLGRQGAFREVDSGDTPAPANCVAAGPGGP